MTTPYEIAQGYAGLHERRDTAALQDFLYNGGRNLSPAERAWCADFVNASLTAGGYQGTGSGAARSFLNYGEKVDTPQVGDIVVLTRGDPNGWQGHVGFYEGVGPDGRIKVFGGNQGDAAGSAYYAPDRVLGYRRPVPVSQDADAQPGGFYGEPSPALSPPAAPVVAAAPTPPPGADAGSGLSGAASKALKLASALSSKSTETIDDVPFLRHDHRGIGRSSGGLEMAAQSLPYLRRAEGGTIDDRIAAPQATGTQLAMANDIGPLYSYMLGGTEDAKGRDLSTDPREAQDTKSLARQILKTPSGNDRSRESPVYRFPTHNGQTDSYPVPRQKDIDAHMRRRAEGGRVDDTGMTVPETYESLLAQQRQLIEGRRMAQMFPAGTEELVLPPGIERVETPRGVFHFDPRWLSAEDVRQASAAGRENDILGLGPLSKDDVARVMQETGEKPVAITERDPAGNEVRGSLATPSTVAMQSDPMLRTADPKNRIDVEPVEDVIAARAMRLARANGGGIGGPEMARVADLDRLAQQGRDVDQQNNAWYNKYNPAKLFYSDPMSGAFGQGGNAGAFAAKIQEQADQLYATANPNPRPTSEAGIGFGMGQGLSGSLPSENHAAGGGIGRAITGALYGATGGRADKIPGTARSGSHVIPADIVSHMGQGNTNAGMKMLEKMFTTGPYGMTLRRSRRADGGGIDGEIPVMLSDGEYVVDPDVVAQIGGGDVQAGHDILDAWIMHERQNAIKTLASLPPPATD